MKPTAALILLLLGTGCSTRPCVDGERMSSGYFGTVRSGYDLCPQKCCSSGWQRGCACSARCPCVARHPKQADP